METKFPKPDIKFLKASMFQDQEVLLTFKGWKKKPNEDIPAKNGRAEIPWKSRVKYCLRYSYPEWAVDEFGEKNLDQSGKPMKNSNYDPKFPKGYSIQYLFEEGDLESGSLPLFNAFCFLQPSPCDILSIVRTGEGQTTKWRVKKIPSGEAHSTDIHYGPLEPDTEVPF